LHEHATNGEPPFRWLVARQHYDAIRTRTRERPPCAASRPQHQARLRLPGRGTVLARSRQPCGWPPRWRPPRSDGG